MQEIPRPRAPSEATRRRRDAKLLLAPFVANLSSWHLQAARLLLEVDRAESRGDPQALPAEAVQRLFETVSRERTAFAAETASLVSSRVDDVAKSFGRLLSDLERAGARCGRAPHAVMPEVGLLDGGKHAGGSQPGDQPA